MAWSDLPRIAIRADRPARRISEPIRLLGEHRYDPPRAVEVLHEGVWCRGFQSRWLLTSDRGYWVAEVEYRAWHEWGWGTHLASMPPERVRLPDQQ